MKKLNTPSYSVLIPRDRRIRSIQELYQNMGNIQEAIPNNVSTNNPLTDKDYVDTKVTSITWYGTQEEYDAITTKDANTIYLIKES